MTFAAVVISLVALAWLSWRDAKRRRVFGLPKLAKHYPARFGWVAFFLPGVVLMFLGTSAGLVIWMGAVCAFGWMLVAITPGQWRAGVAWLDRAGQRFETRIQSWLG